jgi:hypothetical protein
MPPVIPLPLQPPEKVRKPRTAAQQAVINQSKAAKAREEDEAIEKLRAYIKEEVARLAARFSKKEQYFYGLLHLRVKSDTRRRPQVNSYNAFLHNYAEKENEGMDLGRVRVMACLTVTQIVPLVKSCHFAR